jgi:hypothetical protein
VRKVKYDFLYMRGQRLWCVKQAIEQGARLRVAVVEGATAGLEVDHEPQSAGAIQVLII